MTDLIPIDEARRVIATLPLSGRSRELNTNSPSFHVIKLPTPNGEGQGYQLRHLVVEYCIQPTVGASPIQAVWWTCYVVLTRNGTLKKETGVYPEWNEFGTVSSHPAVPIIAPRTSGILIADISKGVLNAGGSNGTPSNGTVFREVSLNGMTTDIDIFAVLVAAGMHDGGYQVHGQATLEFRLGDNP